MSHLGSDNETQSPWTWIRASILVPWLPQSYITAGTLRTAGMS